MGGMKYTFLSRDGTNLSKLDRVLVCENFMNKWPNASLLALGRNISDHSPLILTTINNSFGPSPFRMFNRCSDLEGFDETVRKGLDSICESRFMDEVLATKSKVVKEELKKWRKKKKEEEEKDLLEAQNKLTQLDILAESRALSGEEITIWQDCKDKIKRWHSKIASDLQQKARVRWIGLGDENTRYFHSIVNNHIARNKISGLWINEVWVSDPKEIKAQIFDDIPRKIQRTSLCETENWSRGF
ncbi:uncharacterized protein LOC110943914 [Helianthus annuus]|uniref:uncharacterized protein LOC110943914 n=1 Tax=Helianthus annuus TaxID=4232 RepID=UPI000B8F2324|nr:uncharacterized protein LOC110943914 [Helianthus annuus]